MKILSRAKLTRTVEYISGGNGKAQCVVCKASLLRPKFSVIKTEDIDSLDLDDTLFTIEIVQQCKNGHLNRMVYAANLTDESLMCVQQES